MSVTNINANSDLTMAGESSAVMHGTLVLHSDDDSTSDAPRSILQSALAALSDGRISETVEHFDEHFKFTDRALTLEFTEKTRLTSVTSLCQYEHPWLS